MSDALQVLWTDPQQAGANLNGQVVPWCKARMADGKRIVATFEEEDAANHLQRLRAYWGYIMKPLSEQAQIGGIGATPEGWSLYYKKKILGYEFERIRLPGAKRTIVRKKLRSISKLAKNGKKMSEYCRAGAR
jgi:hypothetical protein